LVVANESLARSRKKALGLKIWLVKGLLGLLLDHLVALEVEEGVGDGRELGVKIRTGPKLLRRRRLVVIENFGQV